MSSIDKMYNFTLSDSQNGTFYPTEATILAAVCASVFSVVGVVGNLVTAVALLMHPKLRGHVTTMFVLSLCLSDLLFCAINLPLTANRFIKQHWSLGPQLCQLFAFIFYGNEAVSLLSMVAITINSWSEYFKNAPSEVLANFPGQVFPRLSSGFSGVMAKLLHLRYES
ncbi:protein trapped in endoderm-1-like [Bombyx mandarina]|uniref:Protein trapped in endoderm-1-like n=1 Tax=Bombyx mandarina TaxID=7092 RepID=A0A6J2KBB7_BOMMA|nr:protein trapped in endoderm-1-like [Bombyx mandarina]